MKKNSSLFILLLVGFVSAFGPFVTDFYLPALPEVSKYFRTSATMVQLTLTVSLAGLAIGQLFIGPLSDRYGRKSPLIISLICFTIATIGCLYSNSINQLLVFRFIQGLTGAGGVVISRSIATDLYQGKQLARFFSVLSSVQGIAPIFAPVLGGLLLSVTDWKGIFGILFAIGIVLLIATAYFRESIKTVGDVSLINVFHSYLPVVQNRIFTRYVLVQSMAMGGMFTYISASPFIFQVHYGVSPIVFSLCFGMNALGIMAGSLLVVRFRRTEKGLGIGTISFFLMSMVVAVTLIADLPVYFVEGALFLLMLFIGMILPTSTALALEPVRKNSGNASAILGFMTFLVGGICSPLAGMGNMLVSTSVLIVLCATLTFIFVVRKQKRAVVELQHYWAFILKRLRLMSRA